MIKMILFISLIMCMGISTNQSFSQEIGLSTFQETAQIIIDEKREYKNTTSITLSSSNIQEIKIPTEIKQRITENERIQAIILTNENNCILGVEHQSCIIINVERSPEDKGIIAIQDSTKEIGDLYIKEINRIFDTDAKFFQVVIQQNNQMNQALMTSGDISGKGIISAVYTMPMEDTGSMYTKISSMLLAKSIRESGGFYDISKTLSVKENAKMSFSMIPLDSKLLSQLRVSADTPIVNSSTTEEKISKISPLKFFNIENLERSSYFSSGNYPLNSIVQIIILSNEATNVSDVKGHIIPTQMIDGMKMPTEITKKGWIFDPEEGQQIQGKYIFGESTSVNKNELEFSLGGSSIQAKETELDESIIVVAIITIVSIGAAVFYLKGYKK